MRILAIADIDDFYWKFGRGKADVLMSCGDVSDGVILEAAEAFDCRAVFAVKGNHDGNAPFAAPIVDLHLQYQLRGRFIIGGLNGSWKYKPQGYFLYDQHEVNEFLSTFPAVDILLSHNSPRGIHDQEDTVHLGFEGLSTYIKRENPKLLIHGHQHIDRETVVAGTRVIGVYGYKVIEIKRKDRS
jgi:Icc-related predicted phosphoesterase